MKDDHLPVLVLFVITEPPTSEPSLRSSGPQRTAPSLRCRPTSSCHRHPQSHSGASAPPSAQGFTDVQRRAPPTRSRRRAPARNAAVPLDIFASRRGSDQNVGLELRRRVDRNRSTTIGSADKPGSVTSNGRSIPSSRQASGSSDDPDPKRMGAEFHCPVQDIGALESAVAFGASCKPQPRRRPCPESLKPAMPNRGPGRSGWRRPCPFAGADRWLRRHRGRASNAGGETIARIIHQADRLVIIGHRHDADHRPQGLLTHQRHRVIDPYEHLRQVDAGVGCSNQRGRPTGGSSRLRRRDLPTDVVGGGSTTGPRLMDRSSGLPRHSARTP